MKMITRINLLALFTLIFVSNVYAQELKLKKKFSDGYQEEFTVLKNDKKVKHGQYIKFRISSFSNDKAINTVGLFDNNKKTGTWFFFNSGGYLEREGKFSNDMKIGLWVEYYHPKLKTKNTLDALSLAFQVNKGISVTPEGELIVDRSDLIKSSEGVFNNDKKIGAWNYYARDGSLIHKFDHDSLTILQDMTKTDSLNFPFLGGRTRFLTKFQKLGLLREDNSYKKFSINITKEFNKVNYSVIGSIQSSKTLEIIISNLQELESEFLWTKTDSLIFTIELKPNDGSMFGEYKINFKSSNANSR